MNDPTWTLAKTVPGDGRGVLRVLTCGAAESGKSTLISRLIQEIRQGLGEEVSAATGGGIARPGEGTEAERQPFGAGDVPARLIRTPRRAILIADVSGREPFTRNLATGAAQAQIAVLAIDASGGLSEQTERHASICGLMGIKHVVLAVNKMDLVDFSQDAFNRVTAAFRAFAEPLGFDSIVAIPVAATSGDGVTAASPRMGWYGGATLLGHLDCADGPQPTHEPALRFPVQRALRLDGDVRGYAGTVASGRVAVGDDIVSAVSGRPTRIKQIFSAEGEVAGANTGDAVTLVLSEDIDVARGDMLVPATQRPEVSDQFAAQILWLDETHLLPGRSYELHIGMRSVPASVTAIKHRVDLHTRLHLAARNLELNEIGVCNLATAAPIAFDAFAENRDAGSFILVDRMTNATAAMGMIMFGLRRATNIHVEELFVEKAQRASAKHQRATAIWFTGLSGSGKSTIAKRLEKRLHDLGHHTYVLDGDNVRHGLNQDLGFTDTDRVENIRRIGEVAKLFVDSGLVVMCSFISPFRAERRMVRALLEPGEFVEVFVDASIEECKRRDPKGLYAKALAGKVKNFTGIDSPYEPPEQAEIRLVTEDSDPDQVVDQLLAYLREHGRI